MKLKTFLTKFRRNRQGLAYVWGVSAVTLIFIPVIYWILSVMLDDVYTSMTATYTLSGVSLSAWLLVKALISVLLGVVLFVVLLWAAVNAKAQAYEQ